MQRLEISFERLIDTGKPFRFQQGMDERILTAEKCKLLFSAKYDGDMTFAFDNVADYDLIERKLKLIREYTDKQIRFYVFCGFDRHDVWDNIFWKQDLFDLFNRIELLMRYKCIPYVMRFNRYTESPYRGIYVTAARWCNQPNQLKKKSFYEFAESGNKYVKTGECADYKYVIQIKKEIPELFDKYFNIRFIDNAK